MKFAIEVVPFGHYADPRAIVELALEAEAAGWDGLFTWDHAAFADGMPTAEPFVALAGAAARTERIAIGTSVIAFARREPHLLAHLIASVDLLSGGRFIAGIGAGGVDSEFARFGGPADLATRVAMLDEGLPLVDRLLRGERVDHQGRHYRVDGVTLAPLPAARPRPPIWVGALRRSGRAKAAQWDGWTVPCAGSDGAVLRPPAEIAQAVGELRALRPGGGPFDVAVNGHTGPGAGTIVSEYAAAGATWWLEAVHGLRGTPEVMISRVRAGPPA